MNFAAGFDPAGFAEVLLDPSAPCPHGLRSWNGSDPNARLAVYRNNVASSLIDALADTFPVVQELVGEEFFRAMAHRFVVQSPPRSRILAQYGASFGAFVDDFEPAASLPYLGDVARLEFARVLAYHCADAGSANPDAIRAVLANNERLGELRIDWHPSLQLVDSRFAVVSLWGAHQGEFDISEVDPDSPETALVIRPGFEVLVLRLPPGAAAFITATRRGEGLEDAASAAALCDPNFDLSSVLGLLHGHAAVASIHLPRSHPS